MQSEPKPISPPLDGNPRRRRRIRLALAAALLAGLFSWVFYVPLFEGNEAVVDPGQLVRSAQPKANLVPLIERHQLRSILNLRGGSLGDDWYIAEVQESKRRGVALYDLPMKADRRPSRSELLTLLEIFEQAPYPMLVHCKSGADRTGLAIALYLMTRRDIPPDQARDAFTLTHAHIPWFGPEKLHEPLLEYQAWLDSTHTTHSAAVFRRWVETLYNASDPPAILPAIRPGSRFGDIADRPPSALRR